MKNFVKGSVHEGVNLSILIINLKSEIMPQPHTFQQSYQMDDTLVSNSLTRKTRSNLSKIYLTPIFSDKWFCTVIRIKT